MSSAPNKIIYSMVGVGKYHDKKPVIKDIYLSYFYGAKIGVIGLNGSGKSSLLRIIAGVDKEFVGETVISPGYTVGFLEQEPSLDGSKSVRDIVEEGAHQTIELLKQFDQINEKFAEPMSDDEMAALLEQQGAVQEKLDAVSAWDLDSRLETVPDWKEPYREGVVYYLKNGRVRGVLLWNTWGQVDAARRLIAEPGPFQPDDLKGRLPAKA